MTEIITGKHSVNLLQPELIPVKPLWSLKRLFIVWSATLVFMLLLIFLSQNQLQKTSSRHQQLTNETIALNEKLVQLENELEAHKPDNKLKLKIDLLALILNNKTQLHAELTDTTKTQVAGFAQSMTELSENHHKGISLSIVQINNDDMTFAGVTKNPQAVPAWLAGFENATFLSGKKFINFVMQENEKQQIQFAVSSKADLEGFSYE
ncbi:PilN domain-containing protein [Pseudocolwellia agarivorans]|uniref:PilN domain-containing protein n=1 Tax=Pseudocolwellia agarivorans TaxID=1911682 RepID=UPI000985AD83|nr:PilN domain-containing protein [Pseudocolwellia agarivorans]